MRSQPTNAKAHYNYGNWLRESGESERAEEHYRVAVR